MKKKILLISTIILPCLLLTLSYKYLTKNNEVPKTISSTKTYENPFKVLGENSLALTLNGEATKLTYEELMRTKLVNKITCEKGSTAVWNQTSNSIELTNIKIPDYCTIDFKEGYKVTVSIPNGTVTTTNPVEVGHNETATFTIKANSGYTTTGATVSGTGCTISGSTVTVKNITSTRTCTVTLVSTNRTVIVSSNNTGYGTVNPTSLTVNKGNNAIITLIPASGYKYSSNTCGGTVTENIMTISNVTENITCTVTFTPTSCPVYVTAKNAYIGSSGTSATYNHSCETSFSFTFQPGMTGDNCSSYQVSGCCSYPDSNSYNTSSCTVSVPVRSSSCSCTISRK